MKPLLLALALCLMPLPAAALPFSTSAFLFAPSCDWSASLGDPTFTFRPPCGPVYAETPPAPNVLATLIQDSRLVAQVAGTRIDLPLDLQGEVLLVFAGFTEAHHYAFTLHQNQDFPVAETPEPATLLLLGTALAGVGYVARRRGRR